MYLHQLYSICTGDSRVSIYLHQLYTACTGASRVSMYLHQLYSIYRSQQGQHLPAPNPQYVQEPAGHHALYLTSSIVCSQQDQHLLVCNVASGVGIYLNQLCTVVCTVGSRSCMYVRVLVPALYCIKGIVQRDLREAENRLKRSVLTNYVTAQLCFLILKGHHHNRGKKTYLASSQPLN
jgi:hypothetical protein